MRVCRRMLIVPMLLLLAACEFRTKNGEADNGNATMSLKAKGGGAASAEKGLTINTPAFEGKLNIPGMTLGGADIDLDGIKLYPGSKVTGINVDANDDDKDSRVRIGFTSDAAPAAVLDYYRQSARDAGFTLGAAGGEALSGTKGDSRFALSLAGGGPGTIGTITMSGS